jgi:hypothetical protein
MPGLLPDIDPDGLLEYSVVFTDRAVNHMSQKFQGVMRDISAVLKEVYQVERTVGRLDAALTQILGSAPIAILPRLPAQSWLLEPTQFRPQPTLLAGD